MPVLKVQCSDGEIYRLSLPASPDFDRVAELVAAARPELEGTLRAGGRGSTASCLKYADEEGDLCTLAPSTFSDFLEVQGGPQAAVLKLKLILPADAVGADGASCAASNINANAEEDIGCAEAAAAAAAAVAAASAAGEMPPPPGLEEDAGECPWAAGWRQEGCGGGPKKLLFILRALRDTGILTPQMFASLAVQWLPMITQRVGRKVDKINHVARDGLEGGARRAFEVLKEQAAGIPQLERFAQDIGDALSAEPGQCRLGETLHQMLKEIRTLSFEVQTSFAERLATHLLPLLDELSLPWHKSGSWTSPPSATAGAGTGQQFHHGVVCDGCGVQPIAGPRFKCAGCPDYDLCGNCYPRKLELHPKCAGAHRDFHCMLLPNEWGKGKGKGGKGWGGKGAKCGPFAAMMAAHFGGRWPFAQSTPAPAAAAATEGSEGAQQPQQAPECTAVPSIPILQGLFQHFQQQGQQGQQWRQQQQNAGECGRQQQASCGPEGDWEQDWSKDWCKDWGKGCGKGWGKDWGKGWWCPPPPFPVPPFMAPFAPFFPPAAATSLSPYSPCAPCAPAFVPTPDVAAAGAAPAAVPPVEEQAEEGQAADVRADGELERNLAILRELRFTNDEMNRELLLANSNDVHKVARILYGD